MSDEDAALIQKNLGGYLPIANFSLTPYSQVEDEAPVNGGAVTRGDALVRTYKIIRVHEGKADILPATFDTNTHELTFETDRFSAYAVVYKDVKDGSELGVSNTPNTPGTNDGDQPSTTALAATGDTSLALFALLGALIAASCLVYSSIRRSHLELKEGR